MYALQFHLIFKDGLVITKAIRYALFVTLYILNHSLCAQDYTFYDYLQTPSMTNPGLFAQDDAINLRLHNRRQSISSNTFNTALFSTSFPLINKDHLRTVVGLSLMNDDQANLFNTFGSLLAFAQHLKLSERQSFQFGLQAGYMQQGLGRIRTGSQFNEEVGIFDPALPTGEANDPRTNYKMISSGLIWTLKSIAQNPRASLGFTINNLNKPNVSIEGSSTTYRIPMSFTLMGSYTFPSRNVNPKSFLSLDARWIKRKAFNPKDFFTLRANWRYEPNPEKQEAWEGNIGWDTQNGLIAGLQWEKQKYIFGVSLTLLDRPTNVSGSSIFEIGLRKRLIKKKKDNEEQIQDYHSQVLTHPNGFIYDLKKIPNQLVNLEGRPKKIPSLDISFEITDWMEEKDSLIKFALEKFKSLDSLGKNAKKSPNSSDLPEDTTSPKDSIISEAETKPTESTAQTPKQQTIGEDIYVAHVIDFEVDFKIDPKTKELDKASQNTLARLAHNLKFFYETKVIIIGSEKATCDKIQKFLLSKKIKPEQIKDLQTTHTNNYTITIKTIR